jgi:beta-phosphoglucomutase-like phosphatase (HAD superfamily)
MIDVTPSTEQPTLVLFDLDNTLFDVHALFEKQIKPLLAKLSAKSPQEVEVAVQEYFQGLPEETHFQLKSFEAQVAAKLGIDPSELAAKLAEPNIYQVSLFPEVIAVLTKFRELGWTLGIFSQGDENWQGTKIEKSGLNVFFEQKNVYISAAKIAPEFAAKLPPRAVVVDDKLKVLEFLNTVQSDKREYLLIWVTRQPDRDVLQPPYVQAVTSLDQVRGLIEASKTKSSPLSPV